MKSAATPFRPWILTLSVLLIVLAAAASMVHTPHFPPVTSAEVDGAINHVAQLVVSQSAD